MFGQITGQLARLRDRLPEEVVASAGEQVTVTSAQLAAGIGNLAFAIVAARMLEPSEFAVLSVFLALFLLVHMPMGSLGAGGAVDPVRAIFFRRRAMVLAVPLVALVLVVAPYVSQILDIASTYVILLAVSGVGAILLALERGPLHNVGMHRRVAHTLVSEAAVRLAIGLPLIARFGAVGGAVGVVLAGYAALAVAAIRGPRDLRRSIDVTANRGSRTSRAAFGWTAGVFLMMAVIQQLDLVMANRILGGDEAGLFAVASTLGGAVIFATVRIPTVLLPRAADGSRSALGTAVGLTGALVAGGILLVALAPEAIIELAFGSRYREVAAFIVPYMVAMGLLALCRVVVAFRSGSGEASKLFWVVAGLAVIHAEMILILGHDAAGVARATLLVAIAFTAFVTVRELPAIIRTNKGVMSRAASLDGWAVAMLTVVGLGLRVAAGRSLWLDEATTWAQARLPFSAMIANLQVTDVHPPLHYAAVWSVFRLFGDDEVLLRLPSIVAGTLLVPVLYAAGKYIYDRRTGLIAAVFGSVSPFVIWYSQEARMYAFMMLFGILAIWAQVRVFRTGKTRDWLFFAVASAALLWTQYFAVLQVMVQLLFFVPEIMRRRQAGEEYRGLVGGAVAVGMLLVVLVAPLAPFAMDQYVANQQRFAPSGVPAQVGTQVSQVPGPSVYAAFANVIWGLWGYHSDVTMIALSALWPLGMLFGLTLLGRGRSRETTLLGASALVPPLILFFLAFRERFLFEARYFATAIPIALVLMAHFVKRLAPRRAAAAVVTGIVALSLVIGFADQQVNRENPRLYDFEGAVREIRGSYQPGDVVIFTPHYLENVISYYGPDLETQSVGEGVPNPGDRKVYLLASFLDQPEYSERAGSALATLEEDGEMLRRFERPQVRVWVFE